MSKRVIWKAVCPACGEYLNIYELGFTLCTCGEAKVELTVNWEIVEDKDNE